MSCLCSHAPPVEIWGHWLVSTQGTHPRTTGKPGGAVELTAAPLGGGACNRKLQPGLRGPCQWVRVSKRRSEPLAPSLALALPAVSAVQGRLTALAGRVPDSFPSPGVSLSPVSSGTAVQRQPLEAASGQGGLIDKSSCRLAGVFTGASVSGSRVLLGRCLAAAGVWRPSQPGGR